MKKQTALDLLGGSTAAAADAIGTTSSAISQWPDDLPPRLADRVIAACVRRGIKLPASALYSRPTSKRSKTRTAEQGG